MLGIQSYFRAEGPEDARRILSDTAGNGLYLAGGTAVVTAASPHLDFLVDVTDCGMTYIRENEASVAVGSTTRLHELATSELVSGIAGGLISDTVSRLASHTIRNLATVGGNIVTWHYPSDLAPALLAVDATITILGSSGVREVSLEDFFTRRRDVFAHGDLILRFDIPLAARQSSGAFEKLGRTKEDAAIVNCAVRLALDDGTIADARIALNGVGRIPVRAREGESIIIGRPVDEADFDRAALAVAGSLTPPSDIRASMGYRRRLSEVLVRRALTRAAGTS